MGHVDAVGPQIGSQGAHRLIRLGGEAVVQRVGHTQKNRRAMTADLACRQAMAGSRALAYPHR
jgi:hypothetical protein